MWMKFVDEDCREEKAVSLNATECYEFDDVEFNVISLCA